MVRSSKGKVTGKKEGMNMSKVNSVSEFAVFGSDGRVDVEASLSRFETELHSYMAEQGALDETVGVCLNAVFDENPGKTLTTPQLIGLAMRKCEVTPENYESLQGAMANYIKRTFFVKKGKGGGVSRVG